MRGYYGLGQYIHILFSIVLPVLHLLLVVHILMALGLETNFAAATNIVFIGGGNHMGRVHD